MVSWPVALVAAARLSIEAEMPRYVTVETNRRCLHPSLLPRQHFLPFSFPPATLLASNLISLALELNGVVSRATLPSFHVAERGGQVVQFRHWPMRIGAVLWVRPQIAPCQSGKNSISRYALAASIVDTPASRSRFTNRPARFRRTSRSDLWLGDSCAGMRSIPSSRQRAADLRRLRHCCRLRHCRASRASNISRLPYRKPPAGRTVQPRQAVRMFSSPVSCRTKRASTRLVASSIIAIRYRTLASSFEPIVIRRIPLHQFAEAPPALTPLMDGFDPPLTALPQARRNHPLSYRVSADLPTQYFADVLGCKRRSKVMALGWLSSSMANRSRSLSMRRFEA